MYLHTQRLLTWTVYFILPQCSFPFEYIIVFTVTTMSCHNKAFFKLLRRWRVGENASKQTIYILIIIRWDLENLSWVSDWPPMKINNGSLLTGSNSGEVTSINNHSSPIFSIQAEEASQKNKKMLYLLLTWLFKSLNV